MAGHDPDHARLCIPAASADIPTSPADRKLVTARVDVRLDLCVRHDELAKAARVTKRDRHGIAECIK